MTTNWRGVVAAAIVIGLVVYVACSREARARPGRERLATGAGSPVVVAGHLPAPDQVITPTAVVTTTATVTATAAVETPEPPATTSPNPPFVFVFTHLPDGCVMSIVHAPGWVLPDPDKPLDEYPWEWYGWQSVTAGRQYADGAIYYQDVGCPEPIEPTATDEPTPTTESTAVPTQTPWVVHVVVTATPEPVRPRAWLPIVLRPRARR